MCNNAEFYRCRINQFSIAPGKLCSDPPPPATLKQECVQSSLMRNGWMIKHFKNKFKEQEYKRKYLCPLRCPHTDTFMYFYYIVLLACTLISWLTTSKLIEVSTYNKTVIKPYVIISFSILCFNKMHFHISIYPYISFWRKLFHLFFSVHYC